MFLYIVLACLLGSAFSQSCGRKPGMRIVGGEQATPNSWPWQLSLKFRGGHNCGATLLTPTWAITAAHCVARSNNPRDYTLSAGAHYRQNHGVTLRVARIITHRGYDKSHLRHDLSLLRLSQPARLNSRVQTLCLPRQSARARPGGRCYIAGWGRIDPNDLYKPSDVLKQAYMPIVDHRTCIRRNGNFVDETTMVCVGGQGHSACNGDSGGPLMCEENGRWVLRGVASWVTKLTCPGNTYSVYARVSEHVNWIYQNMRG
ncbi:elastase-1-like [Actinia tenebrosa]|uniref:Elastase-1-like n=1 Tax=Actinia tenebrosa TaxID=6105 RepID=A0A6P8I2Y9_ACTTE|nr:elastase-1-like [Actinia tenebrosa]